MPTQPRPAAAGIIDALGRETRHALRRLVRDWRFTAAAVLLLGLGIGANTAIFSLVNATLLRGQAVHAPDRLVDIYQRGSNPGGVDANSYPAYLDVAAYTDVFSGTTTALVPTGVHYLDGGSLHSAIVEHTTSSYASVLGLTPALGQWFDARDDVPGAPIVAVLGYQAWTRRFNADPAIIGRTLRIEGAPVTIVGVGPAGYRSTIDVGLVTDFWVPISALRTFGAPRRALERRPEEAGFFIKARLRDGVTVAQAQAAMDVLGQRLAAEYPNEDPGKGITVIASSDVRVHPQMDGLVRTIAAVLLGVVGLVLAVACSNLATLLLVRGAARAQEVSVRLALGASRHQIVRHLLVENLLLSLGGCIAGCIVAMWAIGSLATIELPVVVDLTLDYRVLLFATVVSLVTGVAFGLAPALAATRVDLVQTLRGDSAGLSTTGRRLTLKNGLVVVQVAVSVVLLGGTMLFVQMLGASRSVRAGFTVDGVAMLQTDARYASTPAAAPRAVFDEMQRRISAIPGVQSVAVAAGLPMEPTGARVIVEGDAPGAGADRAAREANGIWAGPEYFETLGIPLLFGRAVDARDRADTPKVAVISETMARRYFGGGSPAEAIGRRFRIDAGPAAPEWIEVVGVAADAGTADPQGDLIDPQPHQFYRSFVQWNASASTLLARTSLDAAALAGAMQRELRAIDPALPVLTATTMAEYREEALAAPTAMAAFLAGLGGLGVCLAGIGLYAVVAFAVSRRRREIGIRVALGAPTRKVVGGVAKEMAALVGAGTAIGLFVTVTAIVALRSVDISTPGISIYRPVIEPAGLLALIGFMALVGVAAAYLPARRAARMDPLVALRRD